MLNGGGSQLVVVHGGVDMMLDRLGAAAMEKAVLAAMEEADSRVASAVAAVRVLEEDPAFNAGYGSVLNRDGDVEVDAAVVDGSTGEMGALGAAPSVSSPVTAALELLRRRPAVLLAGEAARQFAESVGVPCGDLRTDEQIQLWRASQDSPDSHQSAFTGRPVTDRPPSTTETVGALVVSGGQIAAASSTGGLLGKPPGRVGDACVLGAGIWADRKCGVLCSGSGEAMVELQLASRVANRIASGSPVEDAVAWAVRFAADERGATCAVVAVDVAGMSVAAAHNGIDFPVYRSVEGRPVRVATVYVEGGARL